MRRSLLLFSMLFLAALGGATSIANAAPADVSVRIEGATHTIFDRVVHTDGREVQALSDATPRTCDGTNLGANPEPGPTPTAASVDAMQIIGGGFDGDWYDGYDDYFLTQWGPDREDNDRGWWWGILVNDEYTPVGGCQFRVVDGDDVLWVYDAFNGRPMLHLEGPATAVVGSPVTVDVSSDLEDSYEGAVVGGINAAATPYPSSVVAPGTSGADGIATVTFNRPGWKRLKARAPGTSELDAAVASNSIDVCVEQTAGDGCAGDPPSQIPAQVGQDPAVETDDGPGPTCETDATLCPDPPTCETDQSLCPKPDPTCETDPSLCPKPDPTCETDPSLCPKPGEPVVRFKATEVKRLNHGRAFRIKVTIANPGEAEIGSTRICVKTSARLAKAACSKPGGLAPGKSRNLTIRVKAKPRAGRGKATVTLKLTASGAKARTKTIRLKVGPRR